MKCKSLTQVLSFSTLKITLDQDRYTCHQKILTRKKRIMGLYLNVSVSVSRSLELFPFEGLSIIPVFRGDIVRCHG